MRFLKSTLFLAVILILLGSCSTSSHSMKTPNNYVQFSKTDFEFSPQVSGEATEVKILGIDWARIFNKRYGEIGGVGYVDIPVIGSVLGDRVNTYALYHIIKDNPGYDVVFYPQFETQVDKKLFMKTTKVKITARLGKLKP